jgi:hypothetical protein
MYTRLRAKGGQVGRWFCQKMRKIIYNIYIKKARMRNPFTRSTRQIKGRENMSCKNATIKTPLMH